VAAGVTRRRPAGRGTGAGRAEAGPSAVRAPGAAHAGLAVALLLASCALALAAPAAAQGSRPAAAAAAAAPAVPAPQLAAETEYEGAAALGLALRRLGVTTRVLMIAAHPDDENTAVLAALALGRGADVAYLSLTRGEGGQNGIGPELEEALGLIRSEELLAARRLDGARQFFTRAYDFGYSRTAEETLRHWPREEVLADAVAVVRRFRPDAVISIFSGTTRDGHGHHQAAGMIAREAYDAAADPARFPAQAAAGLAPHRAGGLYGAPWGGAEAGTFLETGALDPLLGRSHFQIAMASRSRHRSQDMGRPEPPGPRRSALQRHAGAAWDELPVTLSDRGAALPPGAWADAARREAAAYDSLVALARASFDALAPERLVAPLAAARARLGNLEGMLADAADDALRFHVAAEAADVERALLLAAGVRVDAATDREAVVPGEELGLEVSVWNGGSSPLRVALEPRVPAGWRVVPVAAAANGGAGATGVPQATPGAATFVAVAPGEVVVRRFRVQVPASAAPTQPYFLRAPRDGSLYRWPAGVPAGEPFEEEALGVAARVEVAGVVAVMDRPASFRGVDRMAGEYRRPLRVAPVVAVRLEPATLALPLRAARDPERDAPVPPPILHVRLRGEGGSATPGVLRVTAPPGWRVEPDARTLEVPPAGAPDRVLVLSVFPPRGGGRGEVAVAFEAADGRRWAAEPRVLQYPHIRPRAWLEPAAAAVAAVDARLPARLRVGVIEGAGDGVARALAQLGAEVHLLDPAAFGDLSAYHAIVTGIRAYEVRPELVLRNAALLRYVEEGGTLVVQYNKYEYTEGGFAPYPLALRRPHDRVTDPAAPVTLLEPEHRLLRWPNRITSADFDGWVQERGLYHLAEWDERYTPLLEMNDPGQPPDRGALVVAPYGRGHYVYTGLALFRQLPAGVPGAYRLLANLVSYGHVSEATP
jgi:LmbE family N-acetylglucosaminyl deacetylase